MFKEMFKDPMSAKFMNSTRCFQLWRYAVGHGQLLLRSTKTPSKPTRIDVLFKDVAALHLPASFDGLSISEASEVEQADLNLQVGSKGMRERKTYILSGSNFQGYVIAGAVASDEDEGEYDDPSFFAILPVQEQ
jgi:hypothetical protein